MKILSKIKVLLLSSLLLLFFTQIASAEINFPNPTNYKYVNDYTDILTEDEKEKIISIGKELEDKTGAQAVTVIINSTDGKPIESYALNLFRTWGIGEKNKDNGLLILIALEDKNWRVEVGRGLEGAIPDALSNRVMESLAKEKFRTEEYGTGIVNSYSAFSDLIAEEYGITLDKSLNISMKNNKYNYTNIPIFSGMGIFLVLILLDFIFNGGSITLLLLKILFFTGGNRRGGRGGHGGFGGGGSSGGGGFGGFGGGSSSGGGSSGSW